MSHDVIITPSHRRAGISVTAFGVVMLLGPLVYGLFTDRLMLDCGQLLVIVLGVAVKGGGRLSVKWALGIMLLYVAGSVFTTVWVLAGWPVPKGSVAFAGAEAAIRSLPLVLPIVAWAAVNVVLLWRVLRELRKIDRVRRGECPDCGYDLRGTREAGGERCPECGRSTVDLPRPEAEVVAERVDALNAPPGGPRG